MLNKQITFKYTSIWFVCFLLDWMFFRCSMKKICLCFVLLCEGIKVCFYKSSHLILLEDREISKHAVRHWPNQSWQKKMMEEYYSQLIFVREHSMVHLSLRGNKEDDEIDRRYRPACNFSCLERCSMIWWYARYILPYFNSSHTPFWKKRVYFVWAQLSIFVLVPQAVWLPEAVGPAVGSKIRIVLAAPFI